MSKMPALLLLIAVVAPAGCARDQPRTRAAGTTAGPSDTSWQPELVCRAFLRTNAQSLPEPLSEIRMSAATDRSVSGGPFRFRVVYQEDRYESSALNTYVYTDVTNKLIEHSLFQFASPDNLVNQFAGGHGFTGLRYVSDPGSSAELQYFCSRG